MILLPNGKFYEDDVIEQAKLVTNTHEHLGCLALFEIFAPERGIDFYSKVNKELALAITATGDEKTNIMADFGCPCGEEGDPMKDLIAWLMDLTFICISPTELIYCQSGGQDADGNLIYEASITTPEAIEEMSGKTAMGTKQVGHLHGVAA